VKGSAEARLLVAVVPTYPPAGGAGAFRVASLLEGARRHGWRTVVLTVSDEGAAEDPDVLRLPHRDLGSLERLLRPIRAARLATSLRIPDAHAAWAVRAVRAAPARSSGQVVVYTSSSPASAALAGLAVARRLRAPLVSEFRDPWSFNPYYTWPTAAHRRLDRLLESLVFRSAAAILYPSTDMAAAAAAVHPAASAKLRAIEHGVDSAFLVPAQTRTSERPEIVATSVGELYPPRRRRWPYVFNGEPEDGTRLLAPFACALDAVARDRPTSMRLVGDVTLDFDPGDHPLLEVERLGRLSHADAFAALLDSDLLLLPVPSNAGFARDFTVPVRLYEYLASGRPILATAGPGCAADLLRRHQGTRVVGRGDAAGLEAALRSLLSEWLERGRVPYARTGIPTREQAGEDFAELLEDVCA
jgi:glycosyltransferase involved in cell wall biosynthesis